MNFGNSVGNKAAIVLCICAEASFWSAALERPHSADHLEDDAHRPPEHPWAGLRRHAERGQSQEQPLCEQGLQNGVRRQLENVELATTGRACSASIILRSNSAR